MPAELQREVHAVVAQTKARRGWPVKRTLRQLGVSPASYYRWRKEAQRTIEGFLQERGGEIPAEGMPEIRSDNGSCYISRDFRTVLDENGLSHTRIKPHCPEENGIMERTNRTFREALDGEELTDLYQSRDVMKRIIDWYNHERLHRALGYLRPIDYYRGDPARLKEVRRRKMAEAKHRRRETNLKLRQPTLPLESQEGVANCKDEKSHCR